jgi:hypothetical protein
LHTKQVVEKKDVNEDTDSNFNRWKNSRNKKRIIKTR